MICMRCTQAYKILINNSLNIKKLSNPPIKIHGFDNSIKLKCEICNKEIETHDFYVLNKEEDIQLTNIVLQYFVDEVNSQIDYCFRCNGSIIEDVVRATNKGEKEELIKEYGTSPYEMLFEYDILDGYMDRIQDKFKCKTCDMSGDGSIDIFDKVYTQFDMNKFYNGYHYEDFLEVSQKYNIDIDYNSIYSFIESIKSSMMLTYKNDVGQKIYNLVEALFNDNEVTILNLGEKMYRGRKRAEKDKKFMEYEMWSPPIEHASQGRFNMMGDSILYLCDNYKALPYELNLVKGECIDIATFINKRQLKMLDTTKLFNELARYLFSINRKTEIIKEEYLLCNYIAQCCKNVGYDGIIYPCVSEEKYKNYAILNKNHIENFYIEQVDTINFEILYFQKEW